jgi:uncharacterized protein (DUF427 family)
MTKTVKLPSPDHPISVVPTGAHVVVRAGDRVIAETDNALTLQESTYPAVQYVPLDDVDPAVLERTAHATYGPYKGDASYYSLVLDGETKDNAVWTYEAPYDAVSEIAGHVAFYPHQVEITVRSPS